MIYLDANASEALRPEALEALSGAVSFPGNPASAHGAGRQAKRHLENAREKTAHFFGCDPQNCFFTSGASEANALLLESFAGDKAQRKRPVFAGATEHPSILSHLPAGAEIIPVDQKGKHDLAWLEQALLANQQSGSGLEPLICVMIANNETGIYSDIEGFLEIAEKFGAFLHLDGVQAFGRGWKFPDFLREKKVSFALSGHKMGGLPGAGALLVSDAELLSPMIKGGGQEKGKRGGTPALPAIVAMAEAFETAQAQNWQAIADLRDALEKEVMLLGAEIIGHQEMRLPNTSCLLLSGLSSQAQLMAMDLAGICVSAGSACASGKIGISPVLKAMGWGDKAGQVMRVSLPWNCQKAQIEAFLKAYAPLAERARRKCDLTVKEI